MEWLLLYLFSLVVVFLINLLVFYLDNKFTEGELREYISDIWILYLIVLLLPFLNLIFSILLFLFALVVLVVCMYDDMMIDGEDIIKKIFFIKDEN